MAFVPAINCALIEVRQELFGQQTENTLYFRYESAVDAAELNVLASYIEGWFTAEVMDGNLSQDLIYRETVATLLTTSTSPSITVNAEAGHTSTVTSPSLPGNVAFTLSFKTNERGRYARGRNYIMGLAEANVAGNVFASGVALSLVGAYAQLFTMLPAGWEWVVLSRSFEGNPRVEGLQLPVTTVTYADLYIDSQRRRLTGRGN